jgi:8-oxo-dGTP pyrophosphatase MutT (NUDIX family)
MTEPGSWRRIRPLAVGVPTRAGGDELLLAEHYDPTADETFYRPAGGGIDFGEYSEDAVVREFREELDVTVTDARLVETLERAFEFDGEPGHEIWSLYAVAFAEDWPYETDEFEAHEPALDETFTMRWLSRDRVAGDDTIVYPGNLADLV